MELCDVLNPFLDVTNLAQGDQNGNNWLCYANNPLTPKPSDGYHGQKQILPFHYQSLAFSCGNLLNRVTMPEANREPIDRADFGSNICVIAAFWQCQIKHCGGP